ncbi:hypothetical protein QVD17_29895 [Tagetes erecta]|uniref:Uncharacterized protein n=1 Tax=Tagetes erecta TaxID=13708 RepID=A0AAD8NLR2_TARER|nr:hypothetical protein QVD17_29895 [Tagetes erecta]
MGGGLKKMGEGLLVAAAAVFKEKEEKKGWYLVEWWVIWGGCGMDVGWSKKSEIQVVAPPYPPPQPPPRHQFISVAGVL